jgi:hypothetical protein
MKPSQANQRRVHLTREERLVLLGCSGLAAETHAQLESKSAHAVDVWMSIEEADELREQVQDRLQVSGFDENYNITPQGRVLEGLVDKLFTG